MTNKQPFFCDAKDNNLETCREQCYFCMKVEKEIKIYNNDYIQTKTTY